MTATESPVLTVASAAIRTEHVWTLPERILFRFTGSYLLLTIPLELSFAPLPPGVTQVVAFASTVYERVCSEITIWIGLHVMRLPDVPALMDVGGDTTLAWVERAWFVVLAAAATVVWTTLDRKRSGHPVLHGWLRRLVRLVLGCAMCTYGLWKVLQVGQFLRPRCTGCSRRRVSFPRRR